MNQTAVKTWRVLDILKVTENAFAEKGIANPRLNAELLLSDTTGDSRMELYLNFEKPLTDKEVSDYRIKVKRRLKFEPLQYIIGNTGFFGLTFKVTPDVLIPRQETEILVESVMEYIKLNNLITPKILEIGTGSGCISVAIAANTECNIDAFDLSIDAIKIAENNSELNNTAGKINFSQKDFIGDEVAFSGYDIVVSNPPYIAAIDVPGLNEEVNGYEPYIALTDDKDGLSFYRKIFEISVSMYKCPAIFLEIGDGKREAIEQLLKEYNIVSYSIKEDLISMPRVLIIEPKV